MISGTAMERPFCFPQNNPISEQEQLDKMLGPLNRNERMKDNDSIALNRPRRVRQNQFDKEAVDKLLDDLAKREKHLEKVRTRSKSIFHKKDDNSPSQFISKIEKFRVDNNNPNLRRKKLFHKLKTRPRSFSKFKTRGLPSKDVAKRRTASNELDVAQIVETRRRSEMFEENKENIPYSAENFNGSEEDSEDSSDFVERVEEKRPTARREENNGFVQREGLKTSTRSEILQKTISFANLEKRLLRGVNADRNINREQIDDIVGNGKEDANDEEKELDEKIKETKERAYRNNIFIDDCAVSDEDIVDSQEEEMTKEEQEYAKGLIADGEGESYSETRSRAKLISSQSHYEHEEVIRRIKERFAPDDDSEENEKIEFRSIEFKRKEQKKHKNFPEKKNLEKTVKRKTDLEKTENEAVSELKKERAAFWSLMRRNKVCANSSETTTSREALAMIKRNNKSRHSIKKAQSQNTPRQKNDFSFFLPKSQNSIRRKSPFKFAIGSSTDAKSKSKEKRNAKLVEKNYCVFETSSSARFDQKQTESNSSLNFSAFLNNK